MIKNICIHEGFLNDAIVENDKGMSQMQVRNNTEFLLADISLSSTRGQPEMMVLPCW